MGRTPLPHSEIAAWQANTGIELSAWEASTLRNLSQEFVVAAQAAEDPDCKPPWTGSAEVKALQRAELNSKLDEFLS